MGQLNKSKESILATASSLRWEIGENFHDSLMETIFQNAARISDKTVSKVGTGPKFSWDATLDRILTRRLTGFPMMLLMLTVVFWITIEGANLPSGMLAALLIDTFHPVLKSLAASVGLPWWLDGFLIDGIYLAMAWVVSVMLPPMMIFFPMFTLLEEDERIIEAVRSGELEGLTRIESELEHVAA